MSKVIPIGVAKVTSFSGDDVASVIRQFCGDVRVRHVSLGGEIVGGSIFIDDLIIEPRLTRIGEMVIKFSSGLVFENTHDVLAFIMSISMDCCSEDRDGLR